MVTPVNVYYMLYEQFTELCIRGDIARDNFHIFVSAVKTMLYGEHHAMQFYYTVNKVYPMTETNRYKCVNPCPKHPDLMAMALTQRQVLTELLDLKTFEWMQDTGLFGVSAPLTAIVFIYCSLIRDAVDEFKKKYNMKYLTKFEKQMNEPEAIIDDTEFDTKPVGNNEVDVYYKLVSQYRDLCEHGSLGRKLFYTIFIVIRDIPYCEAEYFINSVTKNRKEFLNFEFSKRSYFAVATEYTDYSSSLISRIAHLHRRSIDYHWPKINSKVFNTIIDIYAYVYVNTLNELVSHYSTKSKLPKLRNC